MEQRQGTSLRAVLLGIPLVVGVCYLVAHTELVVAKMQIAITQFAPVAIGTLFFLCLLNLLLWRVSRAVGRAFSLRPDELVTIYLMVCISAFITSRGVMEHFLPSLVTLNYYANPANDWQNKFFPHIKPWLVPFVPVLGDGKPGPPQQLIAVRFFEGLREGEFIPWRDWIRPLLIWGIFWMAILWAFVFMASIIRKQWVEHEKLIFPLTLVPLELSRHETFSSFFRSKLAWAGMAIPVLIYTINTLHANFPLVPQVKLNWGTVNQFLTSRPWNAIFFTPFWLSLGAVGVSYFLPSDLLFSLWFFLWFIRLQDVLLAAFGVEITHLPLCVAHFHVGYQIMGAYFVLTAFLVRAAWPYLKKMVKAATRGEKVREDELVPRRGALFGLAFCYLLIVVWLWFAGLTPWVAALEIGVYLFVVILIMTRSVAEGGLLMCEGSFRPIDILRGLPAAPFMRLPSKFLSKLGLNAQGVPRDATLLSMLDRSDLVMVNFLGDFVTRDLRGIIITPILDALKMADQVRMRRSALLLPIAVAIIFGFLSATIIEIWLPYVKGGNNLYSYPYKGHNLWILSDTTAIAEGQVKWNWQAPFFFSFGVAFTTFLVAMRARFWWWPFHPLGYALSAPWTMVVFWLPIFVGWVIKTSVLRYGGLKVYQGAKPFFLGLIFGEFGMALIIAIICLIDPTIQAPWFPIP